MYFCVYLCICLGLYVCVYLCISVYVSYPAPLTRQERETPLHAAAKIDAAALCSLLLRTGADVGARDNVQYITVFRYL